MYKPKIKNLILRIKIGKKIHLFKQKVAMYQSESFVRCNDDSEDRPHPSKVCEPIHLASAEAPEFSYIGLVGGVEGISSLQEITLKRIIASFERGFNFLMGDATGVGKGRIIAALFKECKARRNIKRNLDISIDATERRRRQRV